MQQIKRYVLSFEILRIRRMWLYNHWSWSKAPLLLAASTSYVMWFCLLLLCRHVSESRFFFFVLAMFVSRPFPLRCNLIPHLSHTSLGRSSSHPSRTSRPCYFLAFRSARSTMYAVLLKRPKDRKWHVEHWALCSSTRYMPFLCARECLPLYWRRFVGITWPMRRQCDVRELIQSSQIIISFAACQNEADIETDCAAFSIIICIIQFVSDGFYQAQWTIFVRRGLSFSLRRSYGLSSSSGAAFYS